MVEAEREGDRGQHADQRRHASERQLGDKARRLHRQTAFKDDQNEADIADEEEGFHP